MTVRYGLAAAFAAAIALVLFLRNEGYLHGREEGGPLTLGVADAAVAARPRETVGLGLDLALEGDAVEIERIRPEFVSPGLQVLGPRTTGTPCAAPCDIARWPPPGTLRLRRSVLEPPPPAGLLGVRATRPGIYHLHHLTAFYKRGIKAFRLQAAVDYCVVVRPRGRAAAPCSPGYRPPRGEAAVAEAGGPSRYGVPVRDGEARYTRDDRIMLTLTNLSSVRRRVDGLTAADGGIAVRQAGPQRLVLPPHASRRVRLAVTVSGCDGTVDALTGRVGDDREDVPLSVALTAACG